MIVGISGHQDLETYDQEWIRKTILDLIDTYSITKGVSSLARGADQLFARCIIEKGLKLIVVIPCKNYETTFRSDSDKKVFNELFQRASKKIELPFPKPNEEAFYQAGIAVLNFSDTMIVVWDGKNAKGWGGTGDIAEQAKRRKKSFFHINPTDKTIYRWTGTNK